MILSIMKNIDLSALVSIAKDPVENEVDFEATTQRSIEASISKVETEVQEADPVSTFPSVDVGATTTVVVRHGEDLTTVNDEEVNTASNVKFENGVHVVMPVGWFENNEEERKLHQAESPEITTITTTTVEESPATTTTTTATPTTTPPATTTTAAPIETEAAAAVVLTTNPAEISTVRLFKKFFNSSISHLLIELSYGVF